jgi:hypothetical protein
MVLEIRLKNPQCRSHERCRGASSENRRPSHYLGACGEVHGGPGLWEVVGCTAHPSNRAASSVAVSTLPVLSVARGGK